MIEIEKKLINSWGLSHLPTLPDFISEQIDFLIDVENQHLKVGEIFVRKGLLDESRKDLYLTHHGKLGAQKRRPFARWVFDNSPNDKVLQDSKNKMAAVLLKLPYIASMPHIRNLMLDTASELESNKFRDECKSLLCLPFTSVSSDKKNVLFLGFGSEDKLKEYRQLGPQWRSEIKDLENRYGTDNTYYFLTEEDTVVAELGSVITSATTETGSKVLLERELQLHDIAKHWGELFNEAIKLGGTDIHCNPSIIPNDDSVDLKIRIDGKLTKPTEHKFQLRHSTFREMVSYLHSATGAGEVGSTITKPVNGMAFDYENTASTMRIKMRPEFAPVGVKDASGKELVRVVLRVWEIKNSTQTLDDLNVPNNVKKLIQELVITDNGLILAAGPTGSGKSTLMGAILDSQYKYDGGTESILSFEDPIEQVSKGLVQIQLTDTMRMNIERGDVDELTARKSMLRSFLRQDPDKIFIGEVRDSMTAVFAGDISSSGHKTFATFHATSPEDALVRLAAKLEGSTANLVQFFSSLSCIITTKLIASPCSACGVDGHLSEVELRNLKVKFDLTDEQIKKLTTSSVTRNNGKETESCRVCSGKGIKGRKPVIGVFKMNRERKLQLLDLSDPSRFLRVTDDPDIDMRSSIVDSLISGQISVKALINDANE